MKLIKRDKCPVCHSSQSRTLHKVSYSNPGIQGFLASFYGEQGDPDVSLLKNEIFQIEECSGCELIYQKYIPDEQSLHLLYTKWISFEKAFIKYEKHRPIYKLDANYTMLRDVCQFLDRRDLKCFDYGFGHAHLLKQAQIFGMDVYGSELNNIQIQHAKKYGIKIINFEEEYLPKMDVIFCEQVLEHTVDPGAIMRNIVKISKNGTLLHLSVPDSINVKKTLSSINWQKIGGDRSPIMPFAPLEHLNCFKYSDLVKFAKSYGFREVVIDDKAIVAGFSLKPLKFLKYIIYLTKIYLKKATKPATTERYFIYER